MNSLLREVDGYTIAAQVRMERQSHRGAFLLVEGPSDQRRLEKFVDPIECSVVVCTYKNNVIDATLVLSDEGFAGIVGIIDIDFDKIIGEVIDHENLIYSDYHDFDLDAVVSDALESVVIESRDREKLRELGEANVIRATLLERIRPLSLLRLVNERDRLRYNLKNIAYEEFLDWSGLNIARMVESVSKKRFDSDEHRKNLTDRPNRAERQAHDLLHITNGHDFVAALCCVGFHSSMTFDQCRGRRLACERDLRIAYGSSHFVKSRAHKRMVEWEGRNPPFLLL